MHGHGIANDRGKCQQSSGVRPRALTVFVVVGRRHDEAALLSHALLQQKAFARSSATTGASSQKLHGAVQKRCRYIEASR